MKIWMCLIFLLTTPCQLFSQTQTDFIIALQEAFSFQSDELSLTQEFGDFENGSGTMTHIHFSRNRMFASENSIREGEMEWSYFWPEKSGRYMFFLTHQVDGIDKPIPLPEFTSDDLIGDGLSLLDRQSTVDSYQLNLPFKFGKLPGLSTINICDILRNSDGLTLSHRDWEGHQVEMLAGHTPFGEIEIVSSPYEKIGFVFLSLAMKAKHKWLGSTLQDSSIKYLKVSYRIEACESNKREFEYVTTSECEFENGDRDKSVVSSKIELLNESLYSIQKPPIEVPIEARISVRGMEQIRLVSIDGYARASANPKGSVPIIVES
jgi:hypothetical protein